MFQWYYSKLLGDRYRLAEQIRIEIRILQITDAASSISAIINAIKNYRLRANKASITELQLD